MTNLPVHVSRRRPDNYPANLPARRRPANMPARRLVADLGPPVRRLVAVERPVQLPWYVRIRMEHGPALRRVLRVFVISVLIAFPAGVLVWVVT